ncbi:IS66 family insertion sequence element accessory protein TnpA [Anaerobacillus alkalidiazotrophicus]|nr:hypothetical protein [Anaerobacillus alkalidiazotrophicus]
MSKEEMEELREQWRARVADFRKNGQSMSRWCNENDLKVHQ